MMNLGSRLLIRASLALFTCSVLLLIQSAFWSTRVSVWMQTVILGTAVVSYFRPQFGLLAIAALVPLGQVGSQALQSQMRGAEALVLAFLAGALLRGWTLREFRAFPSNRLEIAAAIFGFVVAASCAEQLWFMQVQRNFAWPFALDILDYASRSYLTSFRGYGTIFNAMLLLEGLALLLFAARYTREQPRFADRLVLAIVAGAAGAATLTAWYMATELVETGQVQARLMEFLSVRRWTVHVGDVNAAGSFFAMGMFIALGMALRGSRYQAAWAAMTFVFAGATWLTHSRTALVAVLVMLACIAAAITVGRIIGVGKAMVLAAAASVAFGVGLWNYLGPEYFGPLAQTAVRIRWLFLGTTWRMLLSEPLFGVGIGQYFLWSREFSSPELLIQYERENAHNNFAQIAGELGLIGFVCFIALLAGALWRRNPEPNTRSGLTPALLGATAFILTWLGGHPLLVPAVAYPFWLTLGVAAAFGPNRDRVHFSSNVLKHAPDPMSAAFCIGMILLLLSIPFRVSAKSAQLDLSRVTYGVSARKLITSHARFFVASGGGSVDLPLRSGGASYDEPVEIDVLVDGSTSETVRLSDRNWRTARIDLPAGSNRRFRRIDLRIRPRAIDANDSNMPSVEVGTWEIISKPNG
jgi:O-antigen ligase